MANEYYDGGVAPITGSTLSSATIRDEFRNIKLGFDKLPTMAAHGSQLVKVNAAGTTLITTDKVDGMPVGSITPSTGAFTTLTASTSADLVDLTATGKFRVPYGTTAQRPTGATGYMRFNTSTVKFEGFNGTAWTTVGAGAQGGGADQVFFENDQAVTTNYSITTGKNAMSAGPVSVNAGVSVTVPTGSVWTIV